MKYYNEQCLVLMKLIKNHNGPPPHMQSLKEQTSQDIVSLTNEDVQKELLFIFCRSFNVFMYVHNAYTQKVNVGTRHFNGVKFAKHKCIK